MIRRRWWKVAGLLAAMMLVLGACSSDNYNDARELFSDQAQVAEAYVSGLEKADNADDVADVIDKYTDDLVDLAPRMKAFHEKHPDMAGLFGNSAVPDELKKESERFKTAMAKVQGAAMNLMKYMNEPQVRAAFERMGNEMRNLRE